MIGVGWGSKCNRGEKQISQQGERERKHGAYRTLFAVAAEKNQKQACVFISRIL